MKYQSRKKLKARIAQLEDQLELLEQCLHANSNRRANLNEYTTIWKGRRPS